FSCIWRRSAAGASPNSSLVRSSLYGTAGELMVLWRPSLSQHISPSPPLTKRGGLPRTVEKPPQRASHSPEGPTERPWVPVRRPRTTSFQCSVVAVRNEHACLTSTRPASIGFPNHL